jgi:DNA ligase-1
MRLQELVEVSNAVADVRGRLEKIGKLSDLLKRLHRDEIRIAVAYLSGSLPQGRIGVGWSAISQARAMAPASHPVLELRDVHDALDRLSGVRGAGATRARSQLLVDLFSRATEREQDFLVRLLSGELRQGAQEGVLGEAIARAAGVKADSLEIRDRAVPASGADAGLARGERL